jgi:hypothetical protein
MTTVRSFWSFVKSSRSQPENLSFEVNNELCTDPSQIAEGFNDLFASFFTPTDDNVVITSPELEVPQLGDFSVTSSMVLRRIKQLSPDKAVGPDNISGRMLKLCAKNIAPILARIFNMSLSSGKLPMGWKTAHVVPVYKKVTVQC